MKKILINTPRIDSLGGVSNHYLGLKPYFTKNVKYNEFTSGNYLKRKYGSFSKILRPLFFSFELIKFIMLIFINKKPNILLNPSFNKGSLKRDLIFLKISKLFNCKVFVFIHGWDYDYSNSIDYLDNNWKSVDSFFVLAHEFKINLINYGIKVPINIVTTKVDDKLIDGIHLTTKTNIKSLLFLARIEEKKGVLIALECFKMLKTKHNNLTLTIVGSGTALNKAKEIVNNNEIKGVHFTGALHGEELRNQFLKTDLYIFPTYHGEGLPTTVLEAMAFGLPIVSRGVGGLKDIFINNKMGFITDSMDAKVFAELIDTFISDKELVKKVSLFNKYYAKNNFMASSVAPKLESLIIQ